MSSDGKTEKFIHCAKKIFMQNKPLVQLYKEYSVYCKTQKLLKTKPEKLIRRFKPWYFLVKRISDSMQTPEEFECVFLNGFRKKVWGLYREWNYEAKLPYFGEYELVPIMELEEKHLRDRFRKLNPQMAEANELLRTLVALRKSGIENKQIEQRFYSLTNGHDPRIIANLSLLCDIFRKNSEREAGANNQKKNKEKQDKKPKSKKGEEALLDVGFKVFKLDTSNFDNNGELKPGRRAVDAAYEMALDRGEDIAAWEPDIMRMGEAGK